MKMTTIRLNYDYRYLFNFTERWKVTHNSMTVKCIVKNVSCVLLRVEAVNNQRINDFIGMIADEKQHEHSDPCAYQKNTYRLYIYKKYQYHVYVVAYKDHKLALVVHVGQNRRAYASIHIMSVEYGLVL